MALGAIFDKCFLFASSGIVPRCPNGMNYGTLAVEFVHIVFGRAFVAWCKLLFYLNAASLAASSQYVLGNALWCRAPLAEFISVPLIFPNAVLLWRVWHCGSVQYIVGYAYDVGSPRFIVRH